MEVPGAALGVLVLEGERRRVGYLVVSYDEAPQRLLSV